MNHQRVQQSSSWNPPIQPKSSLLARYHFSEQASPDFHQPPTQEDMENEALDSHQFEASRLQLKVESGTIAPDEQERLGVLQGKMSDFWTQRQERASQFAHNFARIPAHAPDTQGANPKHQPQLFIPAFQAKLTIGQSGDRYEQEADRVASKVVEQINTPATPVQPVPEEAVQRQELQAKPSISRLQRSPFPSAIEQEAIAGGDASPTLESAVNRARGSGQPLDAGLQQSMGQAMGADFSQVRVHTDATSNQLNQSIHAKAFTTGQDVFFKRGAYDPSSKDGQKLIAHELTHVIQQNQSESEHQPIQRMSEDKAIKALKHRYSHVVTHITKWADFLRWLRREKKTTLDKINEPSLILQYAREYTEQEQQRISAAAQDATEDDTQDDTLDENNGQFWQGVEGEVAAFIRLHNMEREYAFDRLRHRMSRWTQQQRDAFMQKLPQQYHKQAFAAAIGPSSGEKALSYQKALAITMRIEKGTNRRQYESRPQKAYGREMHDWLFNDGPEPTKMNCWETVLYAAYRVGKINKEQVKFYLSQSLQFGSPGVPKLANFVREGMHYPANLGSINQPDLNTHVIPNLREGDIVMFGQKAEHVAIYVGNGRIIENDSAESHEATVRYQNMWNAMQRNPQYQQIVYWRTVDQLL